MDKDLLAYSIASHEDLGQEVIYLIANLKDEPIEVQWEVINKWIKNRNK